MFRYEPLIERFGVSSAENARAQLRGASRKSRALAAAAAAAGITLLALSDLAALFLANWIAFESWARPILHQDTRRYLELTPFLMIFVASFGAAGLYPGFGLGAVETLRRLVYNISVSFLALAALVALKLDDHYSRMTIALAWTASLVTVPMFRFALLSEVSGLRWWGEQTIVVGTVDQARLTIQTLRHAFSLGYRVVGIVLHSVNDAKLLDGVPILGSLDMVPALSKAGVGTALVWDSPELEPTLEVIQPSLRHIVVIREEKVLPVEQIRIQNLGGVLGIECCNELLRPWNGYLKRTIDILAGSVSLLIGAPIICVSALMVKVFSRGPAFFTQERRGLDDQPFRVWKIRTMYVDAEARLEAHLRANPTLRDEWERSVKLRNDPRIIPVIGGFLRRFSLDELPQLVNVISGSMSLVGPRPFPDYHLTRFPHQFRKLRSAVRPGITGMWQVMVRSDGDLNDQVRFDTYYIRNWSLWLDLYILARSAFAVLGGRGAR